MDAMDATVAMLATTSLCYCQPNTQQTPTHHIEQRETEQKKRKEIPETKKKKREFRRAKRANVIDESN